MTGRYDREAQGILDVFKEADFEVTVIHDLDNVPRSAQAPFPCVYKGRYRLICIEVCKWHQDRVDASCRRCPRMPCVSHKKTKQQKQISMFG